MDKLSAEEKPLMKIFREYNFVVPPYQRPYSWNQDNVSELFDDLYNSFKQGNKEEYYFLGSIVLIRQESPLPQIIIDGQQRLTTLTILLALITSKLTEKNKKDDFHKYILELGSPSQDLEPKPRLTIRKKDENFFYNYVQLLKFDELLNLDPALFDTEAKMNIQLNCIKLSCKLQKYFDNDPDQIFDFGKYIVQKCYLVDVSTPNQASAFKIFNVLNTRGLDLRPSDIFKADIIGKIDSEQIIDITTIWENLESQIGRDDFNNLFFYIRMIFAKKRAEKSILVEFPQFVLDNFNSMETFVYDILQPYADSYIVLKKCKYISTNNAEKISNLIEWLSLIDNSDWLPPAILFLSQVKDYNQSDYVLWFFTKLDRLSAYLHICGKDVYRRVERYAQIISSLQDQNIIESLAKSIELTQSEISEMKDVLDGNIYNRLSLNRRKYLILRLDSFVSEGAAKYNQALTIEHVLPQNVSEGSGWAETWPDPELRKYWVHRLANLTALTRSLNSTASNLNFEDKKKAIFNNNGRKGVSSYALTSQILNATEWTPLTVEQRQKDLMVLLTDRWELK